MSVQNTNAILAELLNRMRRSWLQYIGESWPWASSESADRLDAFGGLVRRQQFAVERIASLLADRHAIYTNRNYPFDGTSLNYVTLDFVKPRLVADEQAIVAELKAAATSLEDDAEALRLVEQITIDVEQTLSELTGL